MRYFIVKYLRQANGKMDEVVEVSKKLRLRDSQTAAVILDFDRRCVIQASMDGQTVPKDFQKIRDFYHKYYARTIEDLESFWVNIDRGQAQQ